MLNKRAPIGIQSFAELIKGNFAWVDKTLLIKAVIDDPSPVLFITRPCGWGKTLNLSMLQHFFANHVGWQSTKNLFDNCNIATVDNGAYYQDYQGKYPVLFISFKHIRHGSYPKFKDDLSLMIGELYASYSWLLGQLTEEEQIDFNKFRDRTIHDSNLKFALQFLSRILHKVSKQKIVLLIDDYDIPFNTKIKGKNLMRLMTGLLSTVLVNNPYIHKAVITGVVRLAEVKVFDQLNLKEHSLLDETYHNYFGFTGTEVEGLVADLTVDIELDAIKAYCLGHQAGTVTLYTPCSIINCLSNKKVSNASPTFFQRFFGAAITITRQVTGMFESEIKTFHVYRTQRKGEGVFGHWPVPYSHAEVISLLLLNRHSVQVRELLALEIMSVCKTGRLPAVMWQQFFAFGWSQEQIMKEDNRKMAIFNEVLQNLNLDARTYSTENFKELVCYLKDMPKLTPIEFKQLMRLADCQLKEEINLIWFKHFCTEEWVFSMFVLTYLMAQGPDALSGSATFFTPTILDAILEVTSPPIRLCIWEPQQPPSINHVRCTYLGGCPDAPVTHVLRNGDDTTYFELMADIQHPLSLRQLPSQPNSNPLKRDQAHYDPTLFGSGSSKRHKESDVLEETQKDETNRLNISFN